MNRALTAGLAYFVLVFALAFAMGVLRVLVLVPRLGEVAAVLIEDGNNIKKQEWNNSTPAFFNNTILLCKHLLTLAN